MDAAWELGLRWFDTADAYGGGRSEPWIGRLAARDRQPAARDDEDLQRDGGRSRRPGLARDRVLRQVETSLERLGVDRIDLYLAHEPDPDTPVAETYGAFQALRERGRDRRPGASATSTRRSRKWLELGTPSLVQNSYSLLDRGDEAERDPALRRARHRVPGVQPARGRLADRASTGAARRRRPAPG